MGVRIVTLRVILVYLCKITFCFTLCTKHWRRVALADVKLRALFIYLSNCRR